MGTLARNRLKRKWVYFLKTLSKVTIIPANIYLCKVGIETLGQGGLPIKISDGSCFT